MIVYILGKMMGVEGLLLLIPALVSLIYHEKSVISFLIVAAILLAIYMVFGRKLPASKQIYGKEGFVIVGLAWILCQQNRSKPVQYRQAFHPVLFFHDNY